MTPDTHHTGGRVGPRTIVDGCGKSDSTMGFDPRTVQPVASRYSVIKAYVEFLYLWTVCTLFKISMHHYCANVSWHPYWYTRTMCVYISIYVIRAIIWNRWLTHYISWYPYFYGLTGFSITYPQSLPLRGTLVLHDCVWSASHYMTVCGQAHTTWLCVVRLTLHLLHPWGKWWVSTEQDAGWARDLAWKLCRSEKSLDPARNLTSITHSSIQATAYQLH